MKVKKWVLAKTGRLTIQFLEKVSSHFVDGFITVSGSNFEKVPKYLLK